MNYKNDIVRIKKLAKNINKELSDDEDNEIEIDESVLIPRTIIKPILLIFVYFMLSQDNVRLTLQRYISILVPDENNQFSQLSILTYGCILSCIFYFIVFSLDL